MLLDFFDLFDIDPDTALDMVEFALVGVLGTLPLVVIALNEHLSRIRLPRLRLRAHLTALRVGILVTLTEWTSRIVI